MKSFNNKQENYIRLMANLRYPSPQTIMKMKKFYTISWRLIYDHFYVVAFKTAVISKLEKRIQVKKIYSQKFEFRQTPTGHMDIELKQCKTLR